MNREELCIGIDIGGQSTKCGVVNSRGEIIKRKVITSLITDLEAYVSLLAATIAELASETAASGSVVRVGMGAPDANYHTGCVEFAPNLPWGRDKEGKATVVPLVELLQNGSGVPIKLTNDANAAAMGEMTFGVARGMKDFIMLTLGTGVGSGIVVDGKVLYGHNGFAGELGHVTVVPGGRPCNCGNRGCLEAYASASGVARTAVIMLKESGEPSLLRSVPLEKLSSKDVCEAAAKGDFMARRILSDLGGLLGRACADFIKFSAPEAIVLFGGLTKAREFFHTPLLESMNNSLLPVWKNKVKVLYSTLPESDAAIIGAASLI